MGAELVTLAVQIGERGPQKIACFGAGVLRLQETWPQKVEGLKMSEAKDNHPLHAAINAKLAEIAAASPTPTASYEAWSRLSPRSTDAKRLATYRAIRDTGSVPEDAGFFLVAWLLDVMTEERAEEGLRESEERLEAIRQKYDLVDATQRRG
jgi:hypothetical protein